MAPQAGHFLGVALWWSACCRGHWICISIRFGFISLFCEKVLFSLHQFGSQHAGRESDKAKPVSLARNQGALRNSGADFRKARKEREERRPYAREIAKTGPAPGRRCEIQSDERLDRGRWIEKGGERQAKKIPRNAAEHSGGGSNAE